MDSHRFERLGITEGVRENISVVNLSIFLWKPRGLAALRSWYAARHKPKDRFLKPIHAILADKARNFLQASFGFAPINFMLVFILVFRDVVT